MIWFKKARLVGVVWVEERNPQKNNKSNSSIVLNCEVYKNPFLAFFYQKQNYRGFL